MNTKFQFAIVLAIAACCASASPIYVDDSASGIIEDGQSWSTAFRYLQDALDAAAISGSGISEIRVAEGVYPPDRSMVTPMGTGSLFAKFELVPGVHVFGGWRGLTPGGDQNDYNPTRFNTILDADLNQDDLPGYTNRLDNSLQLIVLNAPNGFSESTIIQGLTLRGKQPDPSLGFSYPCVVTGGASLNILQCNFIDMECGVPFFAGNVIRGGNIRLFECEFSQIIDRSGEFFNPMILGPSIIADSIRITECEFPQGLSVNGGVFKVSNSEITGNDFTAVFQYPNSFLGISNCTIADNDNGETSGVVFDGSSFVQVDGIAFIKNSIVDGNLVTSAGNQINLLRFSSSWTRTQLPTFPPQVDADGRNLNQTDDGPAGFADPSNGDYRIGAGSVCIDAGRNILMAHTYPVSAPDGRGQRSVVVDVAGNDRFVDDPMTPDLPQPIDDAVYQDGAVDIGAYEYQGLMDSTNPGADLDGNGILDSFDPDCDGNGIVDAIDIANDLYGDLNLNGIPDVLGCELDCDSNGIIDVIDIYNGTHNDYNRNGVPDVCEDCNINLRADSLDCSFDVLLLLDNSGSQGNGNLYCEIRSIVQAGLDQISSAGAGPGGRVRLTRIFPAPPFAMDPVPPCSNAHVETNGSNAPPCHPSVANCATTWTWEAWGAGVASTASRAGTSFWISGSKRIIVPITDELPDTGSSCNNGPCPDPEVVSQSRRDAAQLTIDNAIAWASDSNTLSLVYPILGADASELVVGYARQLSGVDDSSRDGDLLDLQDIQSRGESAENIANEILRFVLNTDPTCAVCTPDCPADLAKPFGVLDLADIVAFITAFQNQDPVADLSPPAGIFDLADLVAFITSFNLGCNQ